MNSVCRIALIGATAADTRNIVIEGETGVLRTAPTWARPTFEPSKRKIEWPNGSVAHAFSAEEADRLRGPQFLSKQYWTKKERPSGHYID